MRAAVCRVEDRDFTVQISRASELDAWSVQFGDQLLLYAANAKWNRVVAQAERRGLRLKEHQSTSSRSPMWWLKVPQAFMLLLARVYTMRRDLSCLL